jgi:hypothetical protein
VKYFTATVEKKIPERANIWKPRCKKISNFFLEKFFEPRLRVTEVRIEPGTWKKGRYMEPLSAGSNF